MYNSGTIASDELISLMVRHITGDRLGVLYMGCASFHSLALCFVFNLLKVYKGIEDGVGLQVDNANRQPPPPPPQEVFIHVIHDYPQPQPGA